MLLSHLLLLRAPLPAAPWRGSGMPRFISSGGSGDLAVLILLT